MSDFFRFVMLLSCPEVMSQQHQDVATGMRHEISGHAFILVEFNNAF
jgi:hypothetical protein